MDNRLKLSLIVLAGFVVVPTLIVIYLRKWSRKQVLDLAIITGAAWLLLTLGLYIYLPKWPG